MLTCDIIHEFYSHSEVKARKRHPCVECLAPIEPGEVHFRYTGKWDGVISSGRQHLLCMEACMHIRDKLNGGECICFGALKDWMHEYRLDLDRHNEAVKQIRSMLARILWRERPFRRRAVTS